MKRSPSCQLPVVLLKSLLSERPLRTLLFWTPSQHWRKPKAPGETTSALSAQRSVMFSFGGLICEYKSRQLIPFFSCDRSDFVNSKVVEKTNQCMLVIVYDYSDHRIFLLIIVKSAYIDFNLVKIIICSNTQCSIMKINLNFVS